MPRFTVIKAKTCLSLACLTQEGSYDSPKDPKFFEKQQNSCQQTGRKNCRRNWGICKLQEDEYLIISFSLKFTAAVLQEREKSIRTILGLLAIQKQLTKNIGNKLVIMLSAYVQKKRSRIGTISYGKLFLRDFKLYSAYIHYSLKPNKTERTALSRGITINPLGVESLNYCSKFVSYFLIETNLLSTQYFKFGLTYIRTSREQGQIIIT